MVHAMQAKRPPTLRLRTRFPNFVAAQEEAAKAGGSRGASHATKGGEGRSRERPPPAGGHVQNMLGAVAALGQVITAQFALTLTLFSFKVPSSITALAGMTNVSVQRWGPAL